MRNHLIIVAALCGGLTSFANQFQCPSTRDLHEKITIRYHDDIKKCSMSYSGIVMRDIDNDWFSIDSGDVAGIDISQKKCPRAKTARSGEINFIGAQIQFFNQQWIMAQCRYNLNIGKYRTTFSINFDLASMVKNWTRCHFINSQFKCVASDRLQCMITCRV